MQTSVKVCCATSPRPWWPVFGLVQFPAASMEAARGDRAGFETTAATLTHTSYVLAKNPQVQDKLYEQIVDRLEQFVIVDPQLVPTPKTRADCFAS